MMVQKQTQKSHYSSLLVVKMVCDLSLRARRGTEGAV